MTTRRVVVCGSNYGAAYVRAIRRRPADYELAGILARGSARSRELAAKHGVPLYSRVADLPAGADLACAAMGIAGFEVVLDLVRRGTHVLLEHPVAPADLRRALDEAARRGVRLHVQTMFPALTAVRAFIAGTREHAAAARPRFLDVLTTDRSLYATLDILRHAAGALQPEGFDGIEGRPFDTRRGTLAGIPATVRIQPSRTADGRVLADGAPDYLVDCRITVWLGDGALSLLSVAGPVVFNPAFRPDRQSADPCWTIAAAPGTFGDLLRQQIRSNLDALDGLREHAGGGPAPPAQERGHLLDVSDAWERLAVTTGCS
jgi:thiazolinyl imide reductase